MHLLLFSATPDTRNPSFVTEKTKRKSKPNSSTCKPEFRVTELTVPQLLTLNLNRSPSIRCSNSGNKTQYNVGKATALPATKPQHSGFKQRLLNLVLWFSLPEQPQDILHQGVKGWEQVMLNAAMSGCAAQWPELLRGDTERDTAVKKQTGDHHQRPTEWL